MLSKNFYLCGDTRHVVVKKPKRKKNERKTKNMF